MNAYQFKPLKTWAGSPGGDARPRRFCHRVVPNANGGHAINARTGINRYTRMRLGIVAAYRGVQIR